MLEVSSSSSSISHSVATESIGVRRALMLSSTEMLQLFTVSGTISAVTILESEYRDDSDNVEEASSYKPSKKHRTDFLINPSPKSQVVLRDNSYNDVISFYASYHLTSSLAIGSMVSISNCKLCLSKSKKKKPYLVLNSDKNQKSKIGMTISCISSLLTLLQIF